MTRIIKKIFEKNILALDKKHEKKKLKNFYNYFFMHTFQIYLHFSYFLL